jgi:hypothetical protein
MSLKREEDGKEILIDKGETLAEIGDVRLCRSHEEITGLPERLLNIAHSKSVK